jgi:predicted MPP superfamily phosphohydrolase
MSFAVRIALFLGLLLVLLTATALYVHRRAAHAFALGPRARRTLALAMGTAILTTVAARALAEALPEAVAEAVGVGASGISLGLLVSAGLLLALDGLYALGWLGAKTARAARAATAWLRRTASRRVGGAAGLGARRPPVIEPRHVDGDAAEVQARALGRRDMLLRTASGAALTLGHGSALYGALFGRHDYTLETVEVRIPGLSPRLDGFTIAQLSDLHFGTYVREAQIAVALEYVRRTRPDLIVLTGDLVDHDVAYAPYVGRLVRALTPLARHGVAAIAGNHDHYAGVDEVLETLRRAGAHTLVNEGRVIGDGGGAFALLGVDDVWARGGPGDGGPDLTRAIAHVRDDLPRVLLCHNPVFFPEAAGHVALQLSGHTHGGQINVGPRLADLVLPHGYVAGLYALGGSHLYVNRGFGTAGPPARIGAPPEITRLVLLAG